MEIHNLGKGESIMDLFPNPGSLPVHPAPKPGDKLRIKVEGIPPYKDVHFSIRNPKHPKYKSFADLRDAATKAMKGRKWYEGPVRINFTFYAPKLEKAMVDYLGGIADTLDGSHGMCFTYLPIVYQDDCQIVEIGTEFIVSQKTKYIVEIFFLALEIE